MELDDVKGVGSKTKARINEAGIDTVEQLAKAETDQLEDEGMSEQKAEKLIRRASRSTVVLQSGDEVRDEIDEKEQITSGVDSLDTILGGGFREGHIVGIAGASSAADEKQSGGKTQMVFQSMVAAVEETGKPAVYIETERDRYEPDRLDQIASESDTQSQIYRLKAHSLDQQREAYQKVAENFSELSVVAVDSFNARMRLQDAFQDRTGFGDRNAEIAKHLNGLEALVDKVGCPVLLVLQVYGNPQRFSDRRPTWGGSLMDHSITYTVRIDTAQGSFRKAMLRGHPGQQDDEILFTISDDGLKGHHE